MPRREGPMPPKRKPKKPAARPGEQKLEQFNVGFWPEMAERIVRVAKSKGMSGATFIRMVVHDNIGRYEKPAGDENP